MTTYNFSEAAGTPVTDIIDGIIVPGSGGVLTDLQTNGSGQLENVDNFSTIGIFTSGANQSKVTLTTAYAGTTNEYIAPVIAVDAVSQGYVPYLTGQSGSTYSRLTFLREGVFFANVNFTTPIDVSTGAVTLDLKLVGNDVTCEVERGGIPYEILSVNDPAPLTRTGSGFIISRESSSPLLDEWDDFAPPTFSIDQTPASITCNLAAELVISNVAVTPTLLNTEIKFEDDTGAAATVNSITGSDPYTINFTFDKTTPKQFDATGYPLYVEVAAENKTSVAVPYEPPVGYKSVMLTSPSVAEGSIFQGTTNGDPVMDDQGVYETNNDLEEVRSDGEWILGGTPSNTFAINRYVIQSNGTISAESPITFNIGGIMPADAWVLHDRFKEYMGDNTIDMDNDTFECRLYTSASNINDTTVGDATTATNEVSGSGYTPQVLTGVVWSRTGGTVTFDSDDAAYNATGGDITCRYAAIIDTTTIPDEVVAHALLDNTPVDVTVTDGNTLTIQMNASGIFTLT